MHTAGLSWPWATLTSVHNAAWPAYFALSAYWAALVPSSSATLLAILGELSCWTTFGVHKSHPRLIILGITGVAASLLMLARIRHTPEIQRSKAPGTPSDPHSPTPASRSPRI